MSTLGKVSVLAAIVSIAFSSVTAADNSHWYIGGSIGSAWASGLDDLTADDVEQAAEATGLPPELAPSIVSTSSSSASFDDFDDLGWKLYGGYQFNKYIGLEAMYSELGSFGREARLTGAVGLFSPAKLVEETEVEGYGLSLVASYPFSPSFSAFAKAGAFSWETDTKGDLGIQTGTVCAIFICAPVARVNKYSLDDSGIDPMYGLGMVYLLKGWGVRLEWERFTGLGHGFESETDMDLITMGVEYRFGSGK
ncbi:MAG: outer membrane beta-barrel protein [Halioglobus sp.]